jgi:hypothetical protein
MAAGRPDIDAAAIAAAVVFYLPGWSLKPRSPDDNEYGRDQRAALVRADGRQIDFFGNSYERKLSISGDFNSPYRPYDMYGSREDKPVTSIGVNPTRPAQKIAADILARLIPGCEVAWAKAAENKARDDANKATVRAHGKALAKACGEKDPSAPGSYQLQRQSQYTATEEWHVGPFKLSSYYPDRVVITRDTDLTFEQAMQIAAILRRTPKEKTR